MFKSVFQLQGQFISYVEASQPIEVKGATED